MQSTPAPRLFIAPAAESAHHPSSSRRPHSPPSSTTMLRAASRAFAALRPPPRRALHTFRLPAHGLLASPCHAPLPARPTTLVLLCRFNSTKPSISTLLRNGSTGTSSFKKIISLAKPERKPLLVAVGLLLVSSAVSLSVPFTIGRLIDFFSSPDPVSLKVPL